MYPIDDIASNRISEHPYLHLEKPFMVVDELVKALWPFSYPVSSFRLCNVRVRMMPNEDTSTSMVFQNIASQTRDGIFCNARLSHFFVDDMVWY